MKPLTITNSPCAKFTTSVALKIRTNPSAMSAYTQPVASPLTTWLVRISAIVVARLPYCRPPSFSSIQSLIFVHLPSFTTTRRPTRLMHAAVVAAVAVLEAPARVPVLDGLDRP